MKKKPKSRAGRPRGSPTIHRTPMGDRVSTKQAAEELQIGVLTLRYMMEQGWLHIGDFIRKEGAAKSQIIIYRPLLDREKAARGLM